MADTERLAALLQAMQDPSLQMQMALQGHPVDSAQSANVNSGDAFASMASGQRDGIAPQTVDKMTAGYQPQEGLNGSIFGMRDTSPNGTFEMIVPRLGYVANTPVGDIGAGAAYEMNRFRSQDYNSSDHNKRIDASYSAPVGDARLNVGADYSKQSGRGYNASLQAPFAGGSLSGNMNYSPDMRDLMAQLNWMKKF